jgi:hypothetical protein
MHFFTLEGHPNRDPNKRLQNIDPETPDVNAPRQAFLFQELILLVIINIFSPTEQTQKFRAQILGGCYGQKIIFPKEKPGPKVYNFQILKTLILITNLALNILQFKIAMHNISR